jgi:hypothetical protein
LGASEKLWTDAVILSRAIEKQLFHPPAGVDAESEVNKLKQQSEQLRAWIGQLQAPFEDKKLSELMKQCREATDEDANPDVYWELKAVLKTPFPKPELRKDLWDSVQRLDQVLQRKTVANQNSRAPIRDFEYERAAWHERELERASLRVRASLLEFEVAGFDPRKLQAVRTRWQRTAADRNNRQAWDELGADLRRCWIGMTEQLVTEKDPQLRAGLSRWHHPFDRVRAPGEPNDMQRYPTAWLRDKQRRDALPFLKLLTD